MNDDQRLEFIKSHIGTFPDFPKKGIVFQDIFTALRSPEVCKHLKELIISYVKKNCPDVDVVVGLEARGFLFSFMIAAEMGKGCVPIRKKGKLPGDCISFEYSLEYGTDVFEIQKDAIKPGQKVLIIDDLLATGGTLDAAIKLIQKASGNVVQSLVIMELKSLKGRERVNSNIHSFISYD